jgi:hypothetical protein
MPIVCVRRRGRQGGDAGRSALSFAVIGVPEDLAAVLLDSPQRIGARDPRPRRSSEDGYVLTRSKEGGEALPTPHEKKNARRGPRRRLPSDKAGAPNLTWLPV